MNTHEPFLQFIAGRQLGQLDPAEAAELEKHLAACAACAVEARSIADAVAELAFAAPVRRPPPGLRSAIMAAVHAEATAQTASASVPMALRIQASTTRPRPTYSALSAPPSDGWLAWLRGPRMSLVTAGFVGILVVASLGLGLRALDLQSQLDTQNRAAAALQQRLSVQAAAMAVVRDPHHAAANLDPQQLAPSAVAEVVYRPGSSDAYLIADHVPATPTGKVYQLWYADAAGAHPLGTLAFDGNGTLVASFGVDLGGKSAAMVTLEPAGGSTGAPGPQVVFGSLPKS